VLDPIIETDEKSNLYREEDQELLKNGFSRYSTNVKGEFSNTSPYFHYYGSGSSIANTDTYNILYYNESKPVYMLTASGYGQDNTREVYYKGKPYTIGGLPGRDIYGNYLYEVDEEGEYLLDEYGDMIPVRATLQEEIPLYQNELHGIVSEARPPIFQVIMRFELTDNGLDVSILNDYFREGNGKNNKGNYIVDYDEKGNEDRTFAHQSTVSYLNVLPYFCADDGDRIGVSPNINLRSKGQIVLPDGSGAIISFNSSKDDLNYTTNTISLYGQDRSHILDYAGTDTKDMMLGMYAFLNVTSQMGVIAIADESAAQNSIVADFIRKSTIVSVSTNYAYYRVKYRDSTKITVASGSYTTFIKTTNNLVTNDMTYHYNFLSLSEYYDNEGYYRYDAVASKYRQYLIDKYDIEQKDETKDTVVSLNFLGAIERKNVLIAFSYNKKESLTTFDQAKTIIEDLEDNGVNDLSVIYTSWTKDNINPQVQKNVKVAPIIGGMKDMIDFNEYLEAKNINFYPEVIVTSNHGYNFSFGNQNYTARQISGKYSRQGSFNLSTATSTKDMGIVNFISPRFYEAVVNSFLSSFSKIGIKGGLLIDLGNTKVGDYRRNKEVFPETGTKYQEKAIDQFSQKMDNVGIIAPYDYAFGYINAAFEVPLESTLYGYYDYSIPLYQLVISGLFDYYTPIINTLSSSDRTNYWYLLKCIETGSNLAFQISYTNTNIFIKNNSDRELTKFSKAYYPNCRNTIIEMTKTLNEIGIHKSRLVNYKVIADNVCLVTYENGLTILINYNNTLYQNIALGVSITGNSYIIMEEGHA
jgi:hypothetical protein